MEKEISSRRVCLLVISINEIEFSGEQKRTSSAMLDKSGK